MKPKKGTKYVSHQEHKGHKEHEEWLWYMPPAAVRFHFAFIIKKRMAAGGLYNKINSRIAAGGLY